MEIQEEDITLVSDMGNGEKVTFNGKF